MSLQKQMTLVHPKDVLSMALYFDIDIRKEPFLLPILKQAAKSLLSSNEFPWSDSLELGKEELDFQIESFTQRTERSFNKNKILELIQKERKKTSSEQSKELRMEFVDENGSLYSYDFEEKKQIYLPSQTIETKIQALEIPVQALEIPVSKENDSRKVVPIEEGNHSLKGLQTLHFSSCWNETSSDYSVKKKSVDISFDLFTLHFQVVIDKSDQVITISRIDGKKGPIEAWDLYIGAKLMILGRQTTLMQANLPTTQWLENHSKRLINIKNKLINELRKYNPKPLTNVSQISTKSWSSVSLRLVLNDIEILRNALSRYRPDLAEKLTNSVGVIKKDWEVRE